MARSMKVTAKVSSVSGRRFGAVKRRRRTRQEEEDHRERDRRAQRAEEHDESEAVASIRISGRNSGRGGNARRQTYMNQPQRKNDTPDASMFAGDCPS